MQVAEGNLMRKKVLAVGFGVAVLTLVTGCGNSVDEVESALSSASNVQSSVMSSAESQANSMLSEATSAANEAFQGFGAEIQAPEGFDPLGNGKVYGGAYKVTATSIDELEENYASVGGAADFDLTGLQPLAGDRTVNIFVQGGAVNVQLPTIVPVRAVCDAHGGDAQCNPEPYNPDAAGGTLTLNIHSHDGAITVN